MGKIKAQNLLSLHYPLEMFVLVVSRSQANSSMLSPCVNLFEIGIHRQLSSPLQCTATSILI